MKPINWQQLKSHMKMKPILMIISFFIFTSLSNEIYTSTSIKACSEHAPPYVDENLSTAEVKGIDVDIFKKILISKNNEREKFLNYPETTIWNTVFIFFTNQETKKIYKISNYEDIKKYKLIIGVNHKSSYNSDFWKYFPWIEKINQIYNSQIEPSLNVETNLKKLNINKIQLYPEDKSIGIYNANKLGLKNITYYDFIIYQKPYGSCFSKASKFSTKRYKNVFELMEDYKHELKKFKNTK
jgi:polar amino acid transport system substrate-binding protein